MSTSAPTPNYVPWPPPGLEPLHGKLEPIVTLLALADLLLVLPLLAAVGTEGPFWSTGPFGGVWWMPFLTTVIGIVILCAALVGLIRILQVAAGGAARGHGWRGILLAACDYARDTGFVLQGGRAFVGLPPSRRDAILVARLAAAGGWLAAGLLMPAGFAVSIVLGRLGWAGPGLFWTLSLWIPLVCLVVGLLARVADRLFTGAAYRDQARQHAAETELQSEVGEWNRRLGQARPSTATRMGAIARPGPFRGGVWLVLALSLVIIVPVTFLSVAGFVGSVLAQIGAPSLGGSRARIASADVLRRYRLPTDPSISADSAGAALQAMISTGPSETPLPALGRKPVRAYPDDWWPPDAGRAELVKASLNADSLFARIPRLSTAERAYLTRVVTHPAHREFAAVARARRVNVVGQRWILPFPDTLSTLTVPLPRFSRLRDGARAHVAKAALDEAQGRTQAAELEVREVISSGLALIDNGTTIIEALFGAAIVRYGGEALVALYRTTGRARDAETLHWVLTDVRGATDNLAHASRGSSVDDSFRGMSETVSDTTSPLGFRWEFFAMVNTFAPCMSLNRIVFGPGEAFDAWIAQARKSLVREPGDEEMFRLYSRGILGTRACLPGLKFLGLVSQAR